jgi:hypothetical protein
MTDKSPCWDGAKGDDPCKSGARQIFTLYSKTSIATSILACSPFPAITGLIDMGPEALDVFCGKIEMHSKSPIQIWGAMPGGVTALPWLLAAYYSTNKHSVIL